MRSTILKLTLAACCFGITAAAMSQEPAAAGPKSGARLEVVATGPRLRYAAPKFVIQVSNPGDAPARHVVLTHRLSRRFIPLAASDQGQYDPQENILTWKWDELPAGATKEVCMTLKGPHVSPACHKFSVTADGGLLAHCHTRGGEEGLWSPILEVADSEEPSADGTDPAFEIRVTNIGPATERDLALTATLPAGMELRKAEGPTPYHQIGNQIVFEPVASLAGKRDLIYRVVVKITAADVQGRGFRATLSAYSLDEPICEPGGSQTYQPNRSDH
jgi:hypothetical protein